MSSISSALNSYYNFFNSQSGNSASTPAVSTSSLADALSTLSSDSNSQDAYSVNLSSAAQNYLIKTQTELAPGWTLTAFANFNGDEILPQYGQAAQAPQPLLWMVAQLGQPTPRQNSALPVGIEKMKVKKQPPRKRRR